MKEVFISVDVETDGPIPGRYNMLSLGAAAFNTDSNLLGTFSVNLLKVSSERHRKTEKFWAENPKAYAATQTNPIAPVHGMQNFTHWVESFPGKPVCVCYPAGFDWTFLYWYLIEYTSKSPFGFSCIDIKTYAAAVLRTPYRETSKASMPKRWFGPGKHTHVAVEDAIEQGELFCRMRLDNHRTPAIVA